MRPRILQVGLLCVFFLFVAAFDPQDHQIFKLRDEVTASEGPDVTFYDVLGVSSSANGDEITKALKKKSRSLHPDKARHSWLASRSMPTSKKSKGDKRKGSNVVRGPTEKEVARFMKQATERYSRLAVISDILKNPETRSRYDHYLSHGFPRWRGTGYYYSRYRPGLGTVLVGLFLSGGGAAHYFALVITYRNRVKLLESYQKFARKAAWGDESGIGGIPGLGAPTEVPAASEEPDPLANLNRRQRREYERQTKKDKTGASKAVRPAPVAAPASTGQRRRVTAENGKVFVVDSGGDVYLEEENEDGDVEEFLLDPAEIPKPTVWDTAVVRLPIWLYRKCADPFLKDTKPIPEVEGPETSESETGQESLPSVVVSDKPAGTDMSSSQISDSGFEIVDSTGIEKELEKATDVSGIKKRSKKGRK
ncbi:DnaJ domain protein [Cladophialophora carrionii]|uniref:DnaJ domain protein n=1 Tax=Cladophialophora carrionii TaxID=86049 RepID=A0A1C1CEF2_9EURO|nr:DnaJ domain protein [Cladophialophora carrionii]